MPSASSINKWCREVKCAVERNDKETIECLLKEASDAVEYRNPLLLALLVDYAPIIHTVIRSIVQVKGITNENLARLLVQARCPLTHIVSICNINVIERMIERGAEIDYQEKQMGLAALHMAAHAGDLQLADLLLRHGAEVNIKSREGESPLHKAVSAGNFYMVKRLLSEGANPNDPDNSHATPLHCAFRSHVQRDHIIWLLIHNGSDLMARDAYGVTPLHLASDFPEITEYILSQGVDANAKEFREGRTPLHFVMERIACEKTKERRMDSIAALLRHGADVNERKVDGSTPLHCAFEALKYSGADNVLPTKQMLRLCFECGADANARNARCETVLGVAADGYRMWVETILEQIAKLELQRLPLDDSHFDIIRGDQYYRDYYGLCKMELLRMRGAKCYGNVSFFNLLIDNARRMIDYARNHELMESFVNSCYYKRFPIYCTHLSNRVNRAVERQKLMYNAAKFLSSTLQFISPYDVIMDKILYYLNESDMRKLIGK